MEISYVEVGALPAAWPALCGWLDHNCPGWTIANYHSNHIERYRSGDNIAFRTDEIARVRIKVTAEQGVLIMLFQETAKVVWSGEEMSVDERVLAVELAEYNGYWREMPCELLDQATKNMIRRKVSKLNRRERAMAALFLHA